MAAGPAFLPCVVATSPAPTSVPAATALKGRSPLSSPSETWTSRSLLIPLSTSRLASSPWRSPTAAMRFSARPHYLPSSATPKSLNITRRLSRTRTSRKRNAVYGCRFTHQLFLPLPGQQVFLGERKAQLRQDGMPLDRFHWQRMSHLLRQTTQQHGQAAAATPFLEPSPNRAVHAPSSSNSPS